jgi:hypothetical protein
MKVTDMAVAKEKVVELATFTPGEAEMITGVARVTQRDWRRRELTSMRTRKGWTRFTTEDLAHLIVLQGFFPTIRPATAYLLARLATVAPIAVLAREAYGDAVIRLKGHRDPIPRPEQVERYAVHARLVEGGQYFSAHDLNSLPDHIRKQARDPVHISYYIIVDLFEVAKEMKERMIKPYFVEAPLKRTI